MAEEFVEANVFQVPNLVGAANQQQRVKKQEQFRTLGYLDKYQRRNGKYLPGHQPLVQDRWDDVVKRMDAVAANDNVANRRALTSAYTAYGQTAGNAQFVAQEYANERKYLSENANKLAISVADADAQLNNLSNQAVNEMQLAQLATDPMSLRLPRGYVPGKVKDYATQGRILLQSAAPKLNNEWLSTGKLDLNAASKWADEWGSQNYTKGQEDEMIAQVLVSENIKGRNGKLTIDEFAQIQGMPEEDRNKYVSQYIQSAKDNFLRNLPRTKKVAAPPQGPAPKIQSITSLFVDQDEIKVPKGSIRKKGTPGTKAGTPPVEESKLEGPIGDQKAVFDPYAFSTGKKGTPDTPRENTQIGLANIKPVRVGDGAYIFGFGISEDGKPVVYKSVKGDATDSMINDVGELTAEERESGFEEAGISMQVTPAKRSDLLALKSFLGAEFDSQYKRFLEAAGVEALSQDKYSEYLNKEFAK
tara:strand:+ start:5234 stop:6655 length:1422 start_codon:yes stop_codon:yes gene_type:complete